MNTELQEAKIKYRIRTLKKCGKCKFNNYVMEEKNGYLSDKYCHVKEIATVRFLFCRDFKKK